MTEIPAQNPERPRPPERLLELATQFGDDLQAVPDIKRSIKRRALGEEGHEMFLLEEEMLEDPSVREAIKEDPPSVYRAEEENAANALSRLEGAALLGGVIGYNSECLETKEEDYTTADGQLRVRYTQYRIRDEVIVADHHDYAPGSLYDDRIRQIAVETAARINGQPLEPGEAEKVSGMVHSYRQYLDQLLASEETEFRSFLTPPPEPEQ